MKIKLQLFGMLADRIHSQLEIEEVNDTDSLRSKLAEIDPVFDELPFSIAVNRQIITENTVIGTADEIALLPPFAGG